MSITEWRDAKTCKPVGLSRPKSYLVVLESAATAQHAKQWGGMGAVEIATYYKGWNGSGWSARGSLRVAYWMDCPSFDMTWNKRTDSVRGQWERRQQERSR